MKTRENSSLNSKMLILSVFYWLLFMMSTNLDYPHTLYPTANAQFLIIFFLVSLIAGGRLFSKVGDHYFQRFSYFDTSKLGLRLFNSFVYLNLLLLLIILLRVLYFKYFLDYSLSRVELFSPSHLETSILLRSFYVGISYLRSFTSVFLGFILLFSLIAKNNRMLILCILAYAMEALLFSAKGPLINVFFISIIWLVLDKRIEFNRYHLFVAFSGCLLFFVVLFVRNDKILDVTYDYISTGPILLSSLTDPDSSSFFIGPSPVDVSILFSGFQYLINIFIRAFFNTDLMSNSYLWIKILDLKVITGQSGFEFFPHNSLYTLLAEPYLSLGLFGVSMLGLSFGFMIPYLEASFIKNNCNLSLFILYYGMFILLSGPFVGPFSSVTFWMVLLFIIIFKNKLFIRRL